jgi:hypothetical protein
MKDMDKMWHMLMEALLKDMAIHASMSVRPTDIALDCDLDTEKLDEAYAKSEYIKEYNKDGC